MLSSFTQKKHSTTQQCSSASLGVLLDGRSQDVQGEVGILLGDAHRWLDPEDVAVQAAFADQNLHVLALFPGIGKVELIGQF